MNCWEFKRCGCEGGGNIAAERGVCPAFSKNAGQACWLVSGTLCDGDTQGSCNEKKAFCEGCDFFFMRLKALSSKINPARLAREGETGPPPINRARRAYRSGDSWYFATREGVTMGPYHSRAEAREAIKDFIDFMGSASDEIIARFLENSTESQS